MVRIRFPPAASQQRTAGIGASSVTPFQTTGQLRSTIEAGPYNVSLRQAFSIIQFGIGQIRAIELRQAEIRTAQICTAQGGPDQECGAQP